MENKDANTEKEGCCGSSCSCGCRSHKCYSGKAALVLVLLLIGGLFGYGAGRCHKSKMDCPYSASGPVNPAPVAPLK